MSVSRGTEEAPVAVGSFAGRLLAAICVLATVALAAWMTPGWQPGSEPLRPLASDHLLTRVTWPEPPAALSFTAAERTLNRLASPEQPLSDQVRRELLAVSVAALPDISGPSLWQERRRWTERAQLLLLRTVPGEAGSELAAGLPRYLYCEQRKQTLMEPLMSQWTPGVEAFYLQVVLAIRWDRECLGDLLDGTDPEQEMMRQTIKRQLVMLREDLTEAEQDRLLAELDRLMAGRDSL